MNGGGNLGAPTVTLVKSLCRRRLCRTALPQWVSSQRGHSALEAPVLDPLARIEKLLALAADQAGTPEGEAAARAARQLARRFAVEADGLRRRSGPDPDPIEERRTPLANRALWRRRLATLVAGHGGCQVAFPRQGTDVVFFGTRSALLVAEYQLLVLDREISARRARWLEERAALLPESAEEALLIEAGHFADSAVSAVATRLGEQRQEERRQDPQGTALVLGRGPDVERWLAERGYQFRSAPMTGRPFHPAGYAAGNGIALNEALRQEGAGLDRQLG